MSSIKIDNEEALKSIISMLEQDHFLDLGLTMFNKLSREKQIILNRIWSKQIKFVILDKEIFKFEKKVLILNIPSKKGYCQVILFFYNYKDSVKPELSIRWNFSEGDYQSYNKFEIRGTTSYYKTPTFRKNMRKTYKYFDKLYHLGNKLYQLIMKNLIMKNQDLSPCFLKLMNLFNNLQSNC